MLIKNFYACDFETNNHIDSNNVYAWGIMSNKKEYWHGISIETFIHRCFKIVKHLGNTKNVNFYFNNLANFDGSFIIKWLSKNGWTQKFKKDRNVIEYLRESEFKKNNKDKKVEGKYFTLIATELKSILKLILFEKNKKVNFFCSLKIWNQSVRQQGILLNKTYNTDIYTKIENYEYDKIRNYKNVKELEADVNVCKYLKQDCFILMSFITEMMKIAKVWRMTAGSSAYNDWLYTIFDFLAFNIKRKLEIYSKGKDTAYIYKGRRYFSKKGVSAQMVKEILPTNWMIEHKIIRKWVSGGLTFANEKYKGLKMKNVKYIDLNSAYSAVMLNRDYPVGNPYIGDGGKNYPLKLYTITTLEKCYNKKGLPFCYEKNTMGVKDYPSYINAFTTLYLTDIEYYYFKKFYTIGKYTAEVKYSFRKKSGKELFGCYINKWFEKKKNAKTPASKTCFKLFLNSLFGKFLSRWERSSKIFTGEWKNDTDWEIEETLTEPLFYAPIGIWITSYNRMVLVDTVDINYNKVLYGDTDSLIVKQDFTVKNLDKKELGCWKVEYNNIDVFILGKKKYCLSKDNNIIKTTLASFHLNKNAWKNYTFNNFWEVLVGGNFIWEQLEKIETKTGYVLKDKVKTLSPIWHKRYIAGKDCQFNSFDSFHSFIKKQVWEQKHLV